MTNSTNAATERAQVERELARRLASAELSAVRTSFLGFGLQALLLHETVGTGLVLTWVAVVVALELLNGGLAARLRRRLDDLRAREALLAALPATLFASGAAWGSVALLPGIAASTWLHAATLMILAVVAMFAAGNLCVRRSCLTGFTVGLALPVIVDGFRSGGSPGVELGVAALAMLVVVQVVGEGTRRLIVHDVRGHMALEGMAGQLRRSNDELTMAMEQLSRVASSDALTQCLNRRALLEKLEFELARHTRYGTSFGVILLDLDRFKSVNDRFGHGVGDRVLVAAAECLRGQLRPIDSLARWGGEEFLCLIAHVKEDDLLAKAEDLRFMLCQSPLVFVPEEISITASFGAAIYQPNLTALELIALADRAMYRAKNDGRNRVLLAPA